MLTGLVLILCGLLISGLTYLASGILAIATFGGEIKGAALVTKLLFGLGIVIALFGVYKLF